MVSDIHLRDAFDPETLRWPPKCIYCGQPRQAEVRRKIKMANKKRAIIRAPYCTRHADVAIRYWKMTSAARSAAAAVGILVGVSVAWISWRFYSASPLNWLLDYREGVLGAALVAAYCAFWISDALTSRVMPSFIPSIKDSLPYRGLLPGLNLPGLNTNLEENILRFTFTNSEIASDFQRLNIHLQFSEVTLPHGTEGSIHHLHKASRGPLFLLLLVIAPLLLLALFLVATLLLYPVLSK